MNFSWTDMPFELAQPLLKGSVGTLQLASVAELALQHAQQCEAEKAVNFARLAGQMLLAAWEGDMLDPTIASQLLQVHGVVPLLDKQMLHILKTVSASSGVDTTDELHAFPMERQADKSLRYLEGRIRREPENLFWLRKVIMVVMV